MVHFEGKLEGSHLRSSDSGYWKLDSCANLDSTQMKKALDEKRVPYHKTNDRVHLVKTYIRVERGLVIYDKWSMKELRNACKARQIMTIKVAASVSRKVELIDALEQADEHAEFHHFMDLPAELRNAIYGFHLSSLRYHEFSPIPPVAQVSRLVRQEVFPLFFETCDFKICIGRRETMLSATERFKCRAAIAHFFKNVPEAAPPLKDGEYTLPILTIDRIRVLRIIGEDQGRAQLFNAAWKIKLQTGAEHPILTPCHRGPAMYNSMLNTRLEFEESLALSIQEFWTRLKRRATNHVQQEKGLKLKASDLLTFHMCFGHSLTG